MKKTIFFILLLLVSITGLSQLRGRYWHRNEWTSTTITFKSFHRFEYHFSGESYEKTGFGQYKFRGDSLVLNFQGDSVPLVEDSIKHINTQLYEDRCIIKVHVSEKINNEPIPSALVTVSKNNTIIASSTCDIDGNCTIYLQENNSRLKVNVIVPDFKQKEVYIIAAKGKTNLSIQLGDRELKHYKKGDQLIFYQTQKRTRKELHLSKYKTEIYGVYIFQRIR
jgi:hypothetical protein